MLRQQSGLKRKKAQHMVHTALDFLNALRPGGPNRRADKLNRLDTSLAQGRFEVQIEVRRINANEHIRASGQQVLFQITAYAGDLPVVQQHVNIAQHGQFVTGPQSLEAQRLHPCAANAFGFQVRPALL